MAGLRVVCGCEAEPSQQNVREGKTKPDTQCPGFQYERKRSAALFHLSVPEEGCREETVLKGVSRSEMLCQLVCCLGGGDTDLDGQRGSCRCVNTKWKMTCRNGKPSQTFAQDQCESPVFAKPPDVWAGRDRSTATTNVDECLPQLMKTGSFPVEACVVAPESRFGEDSREVRRV